jgi:hypothetical protein
MDALQSPSIVDIWNIELSFAQCDKSGQAFGTYWQLDARVGSQAGSHFRTNGDTIFIGKKEADALCIQNIADVRAPCGYNVVENNILQQIGI